MAMTATALFRARLVSLLVALLARFLVDERLPVGDGNLIISEKARNPCRLPP
jgi:hypothetical protein